MVSRDRVAGRHDVSARRHVGDRGRGREPADQRQHVADPGQQRHGDDQRETARHDQPSHRVEPHRSQGVDLLGHFHRGDLRGQARARSAGHDDCRDQRPELAEMRDDDELGNVGDRAEAPELRDAEKADDDADQQIGRAGHEKRVRADLLDQPSAASASRPSPVPRRSFGTAAAKRPVKSSASVTVVGRPAAWRRSCRAWSSERA